MRGTQGLGPPPGLAKGPALWAGAGALVLGAWVVGEWALGSLHVARPSGGVLAMAPTTAMAFIFSALPLVAGPSLRGVRAPRAWLLMLGLFGVALAGVWVDRLLSAGQAFPLLPPGVRPGRGPYAGRMSPWSALMFLLLTGAAALRFREAGGSSGRGAWSQGLYLAVFAASGLVLAGLGFQTPLLIEGRVLPIAPSSAVGFLLLAFAGLHEGELAWGTRWWASPTVLARLTRRTVPPLVGLVVVGGWCMGAVVTHGMGNARLLGAALLTAVGVLLITGLTGWVALDLQREVDASQRAVEARERHLQTILDSLGEGVVIVDAEGRIEGLNPVAEALTGWLREEALGQGHDQVIRLLDPAHPGQALDLVTPTLGTGQPFPSVTFQLLVDRGGLERRVAGSAAPIAGEDGVTTGVVLVFKDLTRLLELEEQLHQSQKLDAIGRLSGGIAHDFNNLLMAIHGSAEVLSLKVAKEPKLQACLSVIQEATHRASDLTAKLLAFARKGKVVSTPIDVHEVLREALQILQRSIDPRIRLEVDLAATEAVVVGDPTMLENVFLNLGINARDAMPEGGTVRYRTANVQILPAEAGQPPFHLDPGSYFEMSVEDTGEGIPAHILPRIFDPFYTTKPVGKGTGLGLAAAFGTMKDHRGAIAATSQEGRGTTFRILLPLTSESVMKASLEPEPAMGTGCVLVIDDEPIIRATASGLLASLGYEVLMAEDGLVGVDVFQREQARIDVVLLDMMMPRLGGRDTLLRLRMIRPDVKVIISSGFDLKGQLEEVVAQGAVGFLPKPYRRAELAAALALARTGGAP